MIHDDSLLTRNNLFQSKHLEGRMTKFCEILLGAKDFQSQRKNSIDRLHKNVCCSLVVYSPKSKCSLDKCKAKWVLRTAVENLTKMLHFMSCCNGQTSGNVP